MKDILKQLFGEAVTDDALKQFNAELGKKFVAKADYNTKLEEIKNLKTDKEELEGKITTLSAASGDAEKVQKELDDLKATIQKEKDERLEAKKGYDEQKAQLDEQLASIDERRKKAQEQLQRIQEELARCNSGMESGQSELIQLLQNKASIQAKQQKQ